MDGWHQSDQRGGGGHGCNEERQDGPKGSEAESHAKHTGICKPDGDVKPQLFTTELFNFGEGEHENDFTISKIAS
jgi:hypothetical protein